MCGCVWGCSHSHTLTHTHTHTRTHTHTHTHLFILPVMSMSFMKHSMLRGRSHTHTHTLEPADRQLGKRKKQSITFSILLFSQTLTVLVRLLYCHNHWC